MNERQIVLARHALGLPNDKRRSFRNRYFAARSSDDEWNWDDLVRKGWAGRKKGGNGTVPFYLTLAGAKIALQSGETLCPEDFPGEAADA